MPRFTLFLSLLLMALPAVMQAQPQAPTAPPVSLPFPSSLSSEPHRIELAVFGHASELRVLDTPAWLSWTSDATPLDPDGVARLAFRVTETAQVGAPATVRLGIVGAEGRVVAERAYRFVVAAPLQSQLRAISPNPFGTHTILHYALAEDSRVHLALYDALGREVARVRAGDEQVAGSHQVRLEGATLAPGLYVVRLIAEGASGQTVTSRTVVRAR